MEVTQLKSDRWHHYVDSWALIHSVFSRESQGSISRSQEPSSSVSHASYLSYWLNRTRNKTAVNTYFAARTEVRKVCLCSSTVGGSEGIPVKTCDLVTILFTSNEGRHEKNGVVKGRDGSAEELGSETGEEQATVGWTRRKDGRWQTTEESSRVTRAVQEETREAKAEMGELC